MTEPEKIMELYNQLVDSPQYDFPSNGKIEISNKQGIYIVYNDNNEALHVGKTNGAKNGLNQRLLNHVRNQSSFSKLYMQKENIALRAWGKFKFIEIESARERSLLEALTAGLLCPAHIGTGEKNSSEEML